MSITGPTRRDPGDDQPVRAVVRLFMVQIAAVIAIATGITVVVTLVSSDDSALRTGTSVAQPGAPDATSPAPSPAPSTPATSAPASPTPSAPATPKRPRVDVLNQSAPNGSASLVARRLRSDGWRIGRVDDFRGNVSTTTVYWLDRGDRKDARRLARQLGGVRVQPGFSTLVDGRISVILVESP